jgi:hypothetical protein
VVGNNVEIAESVVVSVRLPELNDHRGDAAVNATGCARNHTFEAEYRCGHNQRGTRASAGLSS